MTLNTLITISLLSGLLWVQAAHAERQPVKAIYIPLADHYAAVIAYEKYREQMKHADFSLEQMKNWDLLRAYYQSGEVDMAFVMSPLAMDMYNEKPTFRWVGLMHRDGNALAINDLINQKVQLPKKRIDRKPDHKVAAAFSAFRQSRGKPTEIGMPHLMATHSVVLYKYLKDNGLSMAIGRGKKEDVVIIGVAPPKSPTYLRKNNNRGRPAAFEQSLPWADVVETQNFGHVAWYSKDVLPWKNGHVECIALAQDKSIQEKEAAIREVIYFIHKAGQDIEQARAQGGEALANIADMVRKHIPEHNKAAIMQSLRLDLNVINYQHLNNDEAGLKVIMDLAVEAGIINQGVDIQAFSDRRFSTTFSE